MAETKEDRIIRPGDRVVFRDKYKRVHTGTVEAWKRDGGKIIAANVKAADGSFYLVSVLHMAKFGTETAVQWLQPIVHLPAGTVVKVSYPEKEQSRVYGGVAHGDLGVVLQDKGDRVNVAKLGGTGRDQYARLSHDCLTAVDVSAIRDLPFAQPAREGGGS